MSKTWVHKKELVNYIVKLHTSDPISKCHSKLTRHKLLYILKCDEDNVTGYSWQVIGCIENDLYKYDKDDFGNKITKYYEIPNAISDDVLRDYGRLYKPSLPLVIGQRK